MTMFTLKNFLMVKYSMMMKTRFDEHMKTEGTNMTEVGKHLHSSPSCKVTFDDCKVLTYESNQYRRKLKESLYIQQFDDGTPINDKLASVPLFFLVYQRTRIN